MHGESRLSCLAIRTGIRGAIVACLMLLGAGVATAQGSVSPTFGNGELVVIAEGYRPGEHVEVIARAGGTAYQFAPTADAHGCFRLETGLVIPPLSSIEIEAPDEQGGTQVTMAAGAGSLPEPSAGANRPIEGDQEIDRGLSRCAPLRRTTVTTITAPAASVSPPLRHATEQARWHVIRDERLQPSGGEERTQFHG